MIFFQKAPRQRHYSAAHWVVSLRRIAYRVFLFSILVLGAAPSFAVETISGTVTNQSSGAPISGLDLDVFDTAGASVTTTGGSTDATGFYQITLPGPGTYTFRADASLADGVADQYFNQVFLPSQAQQLVVSIGQAVTGIDFALPAGVALSGTVRTLATGVPLANMDLDLFSDTGEFLGGLPGTTATDGTFTIGALPPGAYLLRADPDAMTFPFLVRTYFGGAFQMANATPIVIGAAGVTGIDIDVPVGGQISGSAVDLTTGVPLVHFDLDLFDGTGTRVGGAGQTDGFGAFQIGPVPPGNYVLRIDPTFAQGYPRIYYQNSAVRPGATPIAVFPNFTTTGINFQLSLGAVITGLIRDAATLTPLVGIDIDCFDSLGVRLDATAVTDASGQYLLGPLPAGDFFVEADPTALQGFANQFFSNKGDIAIADSVSLSSGAILANINFDLELPGIIQGRITGEAGSPLGGVDLDLFDAATGIKLAPSTVSAADGTYQLANLHPGQYLLRADPAFTLGLANQYFDNKPTRGTADIIVVASGATVSMVDFSIVSFGSISGTITDSQTGTPLPAIDLDLFDGVTLVRLSANAVTDANGVYDFLSLRPGTYIVRADPAAAQAFRRTYYQGAFTIASASVISVGSNQSVGQINFALNPTPRLLTAGGAFFEVGDRLELRVEPALPGSTYAWMKDGVAVIPDPLGTVLVIGSAVLQDSGVYTVEVTDAVSTFTLSPLTMIGFPTGSLPLLSPSGVFAAACGMVLAGALALLKRAG